MKLRLVLLTLVVVCFNAFGFASATEPLDHVRDLEAIEKIVRRHSVALHKNGVDWRAACKEAKPKFRSARSHAEYVRLVTELLARVGDSQTAIVELKGLDADLPKISGSLSNAGLGLQVVDRRVHVTEVPDDHPLVDEVHEGAVLVEFAGMPTWLLLEWVVRHVEERHGVTSRHSLWARLGSSLLPFGAANARPALFLNPDGLFVNVTLSRSLVEESELGVHHLPGGLEWREGAVAALFPYPGNSEKKLGYLRLTSDLQSASARQVDEALESIKEADAIVLDVRGVGGVDHRAALAIAGRFQRQPVELTDDLRVVPTGEYQYTKALVVVQDGGVVEAGETLVWALAENRRAITVGDTTGGWSLMTRPFELPSGKLRFRVGVTDRIAAGRSTLPWGEGIRPHVPRPHGVLFDADPLLSLRVAEEILAYHGSGANVRQILRTYTDLLVNLELDRARRARGKTTARWEPSLWVDDMVANLTASADTELTLLTAEGVQFPDFQRGVLRSKRLVEQLRRNDLRPLARRLGAIEKAGAAVELMVQARVIEILDARREREKNVWSELAKRNTDSRTAQRALELWQLFQNMGPDGPN